MVKYDAEQQVIVRRVMAVVSDIQIEADALGARSATRTALDAAGQVVAVMYDAPFRYCRWVPLDDVAGKVWLKSCDLATARKAVRILVERGLLDIKGATMGPAKTMVRIKDVPPYPM